MASNHEEPVPVLKSLKNSPINFLHQLRSTMALVNVTFENKDVSLRMPTNHFYNFLPEAKGASRR